VCVGGEGGAPNRSLDPGSRRTLEECRAARHASPQECTARMAAVSCMRYPHATSSVTETCKQGPDYASELFVLERIGLKCVLPWRWRFVPDPFPSQNPYLSMDSSDFFPSPSGPVLSRAKYPSLTGSLPSSRRAYNRNLWTGTAAQVLHR